MGDDAVCWGVEESKEKGNSNGNCRSFDSALRAPLRMTLSGVLLSFTKGRA